MLGSTRYNPMAPAGYQSITATSAAVGVTITAASAASTTKPEPNFAYVIVDSASARWRDDGTAPSSLTGVKLPIGVPLEYGGNVRNLQFCTDAGTTAVIHVSLYRAGP